MRLSIWDLPTRLFHWTLVGAVAFCALSGFLLPENWFGWHFLCGYAVALLLTFRLVWGFVGPEHSRWSSFRPTPKAVLGHVKGMLAGTPPRCLGHNPAGGAMVFALVLTLSGLVLSGLVVLGGEEKQGPLAGLVPFALGLGVRQLHEPLATLILGLVALHVVGVLVESRLLRENLIMTMVHGHKEAPAGTPRPRPTRWRPALTALGGVAATLALAIGALESRPVAGWRPIDFPATYTKECGACHMAYHPSLLPAASWRSVMDGLSDHFGEDATLSAAATAEVAAWLGANAAETWDTEPANRLRVAAADPGRMTANAWWKSKHRHIADAIFQQKSVKSRANCSACHHDAARGTFDDQQIAIPKP